MKNSLFLLCNHGDTDSLYRLLCEQKKITLKTYVKDPCRIVKTSTNFKQSHMYIKIILITIQFAITHMHLTSALEYLIDEISIVLRKIFFNSVLWAQTSGVYIIAT